MSFPKKLIIKSDPPNYGAFKIGNLPKTGMNKTLGPYAAYVEDPIEDTVTYQKDIRNPIWRDPTNATSLATKPMSTHYKNTHGHLSYSAKK